MIRVPQKRRVVLVRDDSIPLYRQIYEHFRIAITHGQLRPGDRLPSVRRLAQDVLKFSLVSTLVPYDPFDLTGRAVCGRMSDQLPAHP
jgi:hypothetical protein